MNPQPESRAPVSGAELSRTCVLRERVSLRLGLPFRRKKVVRFRTIVVNCRKTPVVAGALAAKISTSRRPVAEL